MNNYGYDKFIVCSDCGASYTIAGLHECYPEQEPCEYRAAHGLPACNNPPGYVGCGCNPPDWFERQGGAA
jgi:hypothetical protein